MDQEPQEMEWQKLSKALFGGRKTTDEGLFTYQVMDRVRNLAPASSDLAWGPFIRWLIPLVGAGLASIFLASHPPQLGVSELMESTLFQTSSASNNTMTPYWEELP